jgi:hypothetical protein
MGKHHISRSQDQLASVLRPHPPTLDDDGQPKAWRRHRIDAGPALLHLGDARPGPGQWRPASRYQQKHRRRVPAPEIFAHVIRLEADREERTAEDWAYETPSFRDFSSLKRFILQRSPPGRYRLWVYYAWDRPCRNPLGKTTLSITAGRCVDGDDVER